jgi:hypothetical protein
MSILQSYPKGTPKKEDYIIGTSIPPVNSDEKPTTRNFSVANIAAFANSYSLGYTVYTALITQTGAADPVATVLQNTTGQTLVYERTSGGEYTITASSSLFTANKTIVFLNGGSAENNHDVAWGRASDTVINLSTHNSDGKFTGGSIEIRIYS